MPYRRYEVKRNLNFSATLRHRHPSGRMTRSSSVLPLDEPRGEDLAAFPGMYPAHATVGKSHVAVTVSGGQVVAPWTVIAGYRIHMPIGSVVRTDAKHWTVRARCNAVPAADVSIPSRIAITARTTNISIRVKVWF